MDKLWIVLLFLCVFFMINNLVKRVVFHYLASKSEPEVFSATAEEKEDAKVFWKAEGLRREPEQAEFDLPKEDFFGNEKTEFSENFEDELKNLSEEEAEKILEEAGLFEKEGDRK